MQDEDTKTTRIRQLNDKMRQSLSGRIMLTAGVNALPIDSQMNLLRAVSQFDDFTEANDPHFEHDFGRIVQDKCTFLWKFDYYDTEMHFGSEDPSNDSITTRVLTIMLAEEY